MVLTCIADCKYLFKVYYKSKQTSTYVKQKRWNKKGVKIAHCYQKKGNKEQ